MLNHAMTSPTIPERVVIMGAGGFVGSTIRRKLEAAGASILALTRAEVDLLQPEAGALLASVLHPKDSFVAASALAPVKSAEMLRDNIIMIAAMAEALKARPVAHVLNIGSDAVFADCDALLTEASCRAPSSLHGIMHLTREVMLAEAACQAPFATLRPTLIYGGDDPHNGYGPNRFQRLAQKGQDIVLFGEGEERRDHVWVEDVAELAVRILLHRSSGSLNAATGTVISFRDCAEAIVELYRSASRIIGSERSAPMPHNGYRAFDPSATRRAFPDFRYTASFDGFSKLNGDIV